MTTVCGLRIAVLGMSQVHDLAESRQATDTAHALLANSWLGQTYVHFGLGPRSGRR
ncbi:hypothetical protein [Micromonospora marina]|uniref:hypothetical protein n=1 Tax=Micromonospora marina TaxID=307120 RepID=UPI0034512C77